jgi:hypothetical protein
MSGEGRVSFPRARSADDIRQGSAQLGALCLPSPPPKQTSVSRHGAVLILTPVATRRALIFFFALDSDQLTHGLLSAALPIFGALVALLGDWLSFRERG